MQLFMNKDANCHFMFPALQFANSERDDQKKNWKMGDPTKFD